MRVLFGAALSALGVALIVFRAPAAERGVEWYVRFAGKTPSEPEAGTRESALRRVCMLFGAVFIVIGLSYLIGG